MTDHSQARAAMIAEQIVPRGVTDPAVLLAMQTVPRHRFVPENNQDLAYRDGPVAIGEGQTISQPYVVALMTEALRLSPGMKVLEIGTGSGYQTAVLDAMGVRVSSIEIRPHLAERAATLLDEIGVHNVVLHTGNGFAGLPEGAPYDRIMVTASPASVPARLVSQLMPNGEMLIPVGERNKQMLIRIRKRANGWDEEPLIPVLFVPMTGECD